MGVAVISGRVPKLHQKLLGLGQSLGRNAALRNHTQTFHSESSGKHAEIVACSLSGKSHGAPRSFAQQIAQRIPAGAWDSHMHVIDHNYVLSPDAVYRPSSFPLEDALTFESSIGIENVVLVQPSIYGHDNSCLLDALRKIGPLRGRGVVSFDPFTISQTQLEEWHRLGVRGVRFNIQSTARSVDLKQLETRLRKFAMVVSPMDWVVQLYVPMSLMEPLESIIPSLNVRVCIDHLGHPSLPHSNVSDPYQIPGFKSLARLLLDNHIFLKLSAPYRMSRLDNHLDLEPVAREIIRLRGATRVVFGTDWPHTRFEELDIRPWIGTILDWCSHDDALLERLFRDNARDLWDAARH